MLKTVELPLWALLLILAFAAVTFASHFLVPSVRWFFRRRMERAVARLNTRLERPIQPFKLARRHDTIQRLIYDPSVAEAVAARAREAAIPENVAFEEARRHAREIVPGFSATAYFTVAIRAARWLSQSLYTVRLQPRGEDPLAGIDPAATVVFVMNHRSNMDYVLVTWLAAERSALSYAVGEWARVWPLTILIRAMGAYFIRRRERGALYRAVLARYVRMATAAGVTQAVFPEGRLSRDGRMAPARLGLLGYMAEGGQAGGREVVFVPVALNYDRVLEDRVLTRDAAAGGRPMRAEPGRILRLAGGHLWQRVTGRFRGYGTAEVHYGAPLALSEVLREAPAHPAAALGRRLGCRIAAAIPVLAVPLVASLLLGRGGAAPREALTAEAARTLDRLHAAGAPIPAGAPASVVAEGLGHLLGRRLAVEGAAGVAPAPGAGPLLAFYAASIAHHLEAGPRRQANFR